MLEVYSSTLGPETQYIKDFQFLLIPAKYVGLVPSNVPQSLFSKSLQIYRSQNTRPFDSS
jgi:hypothetical protein